MKRTTLAIPYTLFLLVFVVLPLIVIIYYGFTNGEGELSLIYAKEFFLNKRLVATLFYSVFIGVLSTLICLFIAFPVAYILAKGVYSDKYAFVLIFVIPMWINFTLRITALKEILSFFEGNIAFYPMLNTIICMVYDFLPFMILPIYNSISRLPNSFLEVASDLGAKPFTVIKKVVIPLSIPGIISGVTMVLLSSMTNYVVLDMVYNPTYIMGSLIGSYFAAYDWHRGSLISVILLAAICLFTYVLGRVERTYGRVE